MPNSRQSSTPPLVITPTSAYTATVIFCHGLGQSPALYELDIQAMAAQFPFVKWILPSARAKPVSYNGGALHPSWFDIQVLPPHPDDYDESGTSESMATIESFILSELHHGIAPNRIVLSGFSQGATLCLLTALASWHEIGGVGCMSGWIPQRARACEHIVGNEPCVPVFWAHGAADTEIPLRTARESIDFLKEELKVHNDQMIKVVEYPDIGHEATEEMFRDFSLWLKEILSK